MAKGSDNPFPSLLVVEGTAPASPAAGDQRLFIDSADHKLKRKDSSGTVTTVEGGGTGGGSSGLLALVQYRPSASTSFTTTSATSADVDATNLALTFTAPTSGQVLIRLNAVASWPSATGTPTADSYLWCVRDASGLVAGTETVALRSHAYGNDGRVAVEIVKSGLTGGSSYTWKWGHMLSANDTLQGRILCGNTGSTPIWGAAVMSVWAA